MAVTSVKNKVKSGSLLVGNYFYNPGVYESIATYSGTGSSGTIDFTSIPSTYKHLQLRIFANGTDITRIRVGNGSIDTGSNYSRHALSGDGASVSTYYVSTDTLGTMLDTPSTSNIYGVAICDILDYGNVSKYKTFRTLSGYDQNGYGIVQLSSTAWRSTSAINSIRIFMPSGNYTTASRFALYGIKG